MANISNLQLSMDPQWPDQTAHVCVWHLVSTCSGKIGPLYYHYTLSILAVLLAALLLVVLLVY